MGKTKKHTGSCHCGDVKYAVEIDPSKGSRCNCSICTKIAQVGGMVKPAAFELLAGKDKLSSYVWGQKVSTRYFCKSCGVHVYGAGHLAEIGGDFVSVNLNTLDDVDPADVAVTYWDGRHDNWQAGQRETPWPIRAKA
jgi:hypothetical protein